MPITFLWPPMLASLLLLVPLTALYLVVRRRRRALAARAGGFGVAPRGVAGPGWRRSVPPLFTLAALALLGLAMARPQMSVALPHLESTLILAFDVSGSMAATDVEPTRLDAAKAIAERFARVQPPTVRVGVVAFSDGGLTLQPPTNDADLVLATIQRLEPQRSTAVGEGILAGLRIIVAEVEAAGAAVGATAAAPQPAPATIVLFSDGENNGQPDPREIAAEAAKLGVRVYTVGVGTAEGTALEVEGFSLHSRLDEAALRAIAELSGGAYYSAQDSAGLEAISSAVGAQMVLREEPTEITALLTGASIALLLIGGLCSLVWFNRLA